MSGAGGPWELLARNAERLPTRPPEANTGERERTVEPREVVIGAPDLNRNEHRSR